ncbi:MAG: sporulation protein YqfD [Clostridium sp.]
MSIIKKFNKSIIRLEIRALHPENFINKLWMEDIYIENVKKDNVSTIYIDIEAKDLDKVRILGEKESIGLYEVGKRGRNYYNEKFKKRKILYSGIVILVALTYYMSTYLWSISIVTESAVSPHEIRQLLKTKGIVPGIKKSDIDIFSLEKLLCAENKEVIWSRVRVDGTRLTIKIAERQTPPDIEVDTTPCDLVANKEGVIKNVYTKSGTAIVKDGDIVKVGDVLVKGIQGKEEATYEVRAEGDVIGETYYERETVIDTNNPKRIRTGKMVENKYVILFGKKIYLKGGLNNFENYDKIEETYLFIKKECIYEVEEINITDENIEGEIKKIYDKLYSDIIINFNKKIKVINTIRESSEEAQGIYKVRVLIIAEEDISVPKAMEE